MQAMNNRKSAKRLRESIFEEQTPYGCSCICAIFFLHLYWIVF